MSENLIIFNARIVTPIGFSARKRPRNVRTGNQRTEPWKSPKESSLTLVKTVAKTATVTINTTWIIKRRGHRLLPGFVDSHTHFVFGGERSEEFSWRLNGESYMSIMEREAGIGKHRKRTRQMNFLKLRSTAEGLRKE